MALIRPRIGQYSSGRRAVLYKYMNFKKEYADVGPVDLTSGSTYVDSDGDTWNLAGNTTAVNFNLMVDGLQIVRNTAISASFGIKPASKIVGLSPLDRIIAIGRITSIEATLAGSKVSFTIDRHPTRQSGGFLIHTDTGDEVINPYLVSDTTVYQTKVIAAHDNQLLVIENAGLTYCTRRQLSTADFPESVPRDVPVVTGTNYAGYYSGEGHTTPSTNAIDVANTSCTFAVTSTGDIARAVLEEFWLYRIEG